VLKSGNLVDELFPTKKMGGRKWKTQGSSLFVDPGTAGTGWAFFKRLTLIKPTPPCETGVIKPRIGDFQAKAMAISVEFRAVVHRLRPQIVVAEFPALWSNAKSKAAAKRGDLFKLSYLIGALAVAAGMRPLTLVPPDRWKGQLGKDEVIHRISRSWIGGSRLRDHEGDAVGMGYAAQNALNLRQKPGRVRSTARQKGRRPSP